MTIGWVRITGFSGDSRLAQVVKVFCRLGSSGGVMHGTIDPFDSAFFKETTLVLDLWQTGITSGNETKMISRTFSWAA